MIVFVCGGFVVSLCIWLVCVGVDWWYCVWFWSVCCCGLYQWFGFVWFGYVGYCGFCFFDWFFWCWFCYWFVYVGDVEMSFLFGMSGLFFGFVCGVLFGYVLQCGGFGNGCWFIVQLWLQDWIVFNVMFIVILVFVGGLYVLEFVGVMYVVDLFVFIIYLWVMLLGGVLIGVGMGLGGYCFGILVVGVVVGCIDGIVFFVGLIVGVIVFVGIYMLIVLLFIVVVGLLLQIFGELFGLLVWVVLVILVGVVVGVWWFICCSGGDFFIICVD